MTPRARAAFSILLISLLLVGPQAARALSASKAQSQHRPVYPTPEAAFRLVPHKPKQEGWENPLHVEMLVPMRNGFALLMSSAEHTCSGCSADLSVAYVRRHRGRWRSRRTWWKIYSDGQTGAFSGIHQIHIGRPDPTILIHGSTMGQGCYAGTIGLVELDLTRPKFRLVRAPYESSYVEGGPSERIDYEARLRALKDGRGISIRYHGIIPHNQHIDQTVYYYGRGDRWKPHPGMFKHDCAEDWRLTPP